MATNENARMTKKEAFANIVKILEESGQPVLVDFMNHEIELLNARSGANKKLTDAQKQNLTLMDKICEILAAADHPMSISQLMDVESLSDIKSNQHCNSLMIKLRKAGRVQRIETKEGTMFSLVTEADDFQNEED